MAPTINRMYETANGSYPTWWGPFYVCLHYTGGAGRANGETARANAQYYQRMGAVIQCGAHYFVGDDGIYSSTPEGRGAWTQGNYYANHQCISIEVVAGWGEGYSAMEISLLQELVPWLMERYSVPASRVIRHYDVCDVFPGATIDPHKTCPQGYTDPASWARLKSQILEADVITDQDIERIAQRTTHAVWEYMYDGDDVFPPMPKDLVHNPYNMLRTMPELVAEYTWPQDQTPMPEGMTRNQYDKARAAILKLDELIDRMEAVEAKLDLLMDE